MKAWIDFYDYYLADLPGCTFFAAQNELRRAAQEFCQLTKAWKADLDPVTTSTESVYDFEISQDQEVVQMIWAKLDGQPLRILLDDETTDAQAIKALDPRTFQLEQAPAAGLAVTMRCALKPSNASGGVEDQLYAQYAEAIAYGAKARLMLQPQKPYTDMKLAAVMQAKFDEQVARVSVRVARAHSSAPIRVKASFM